MVLRYLIRDPEKTYSGCRGQKGMGQNGFARMLQAAFRALKYFYFWIRNDRHILRNTCFTEEGLRNMVGQVHIVADVSLFLLQVLYLGAASGTTVSHVSDVVGPEGMVYAVEFSHRSGR
jgi:hypothetical protein